MAVKGVTKGFTLTPPKMLTCTEGDHPLYVSIFDWSPRPIVDVPMQMRPTATTSTGRPKPLGHANIGVTKTYLKTLKAS